MKPQRADEFPFFRVVALKKEMLIRESNTALGSKMTLLVILLSRSVPIQGHIFLP